MPFVPPPPLAEGVPAGPLINPTLMENYSPHDIKLEPRSPTPVLSENIDIANDVPDIPVKLPREKGATRPAFDEALKTLSGTLKRKNKITTSTCLLCPYTHKRAVHKHIYIYIHVPCTTDKFSYILNASKEVFY